MLRAIGGERFDVHSAGLEAGGLRDEAVRVMAEIGINIHGQTSKTVAGYAGQRFDWVLTVCDTARERCPVFPNAARSAHWPVDDPSAVDGPEEARLASFRRARNDLRERIGEFVVATSRQDDPKPST